MLYARYILNVGEAKIAIKKKRLLNLNFEKKKIKALRSAVLGIRARSAVRRGECLKVSVESEKNGGLSGPLGISIFVSRCITVVPCFY